MLLKKRTISFHRHLRLWNKDAPFAERYARRAIALLRQAVAAGYQDAAHMKKDPDLDSLRGRDDFEKLLKEMDAKQAK